MRKIKKVDFKLVGGIFLASVVLALAFIAVQDIVKSRASRPSVLGKGGKYGGCITIQSGELRTSVGGFIVPGFDEWGYNYQAWIFNGGYCDAYRDADWCQSYKDINLIMKWNDAWLSNKDCDEDDLLDRHFGFGSYIGSGAWLTNHQWGSYEEDGKDCTWNYFVKIVAAPADAEKQDGDWYSADGEKIGEEIWGSFAIIQQVNNDPCAGYHGIESLSPVGPGFGKYKP